MNINWAALNWLDYTLLPLGLAMVIEGIAKGLTRVAIGLAALVLGLLAGIWFYGPVAALFHPFVASQSIANLCGFLALFVGFQIAGAVLAWILSKLLKSAGLSWVDRLLGAAFGLAKAALVAIALVLALTAFPLKPFPNAVAESQVAPYVIDLSRMLAAVAPKEMKDAFAESYDRILKIWSDATGQPVPKRSV